jgi:hypothetical protein
VEQPYCRTDGKLQISGPDQLGWVYDSKRNLLWATPGITWGGGGNLCPDPSKFVSNIMAFDPVTKDWVDIRPNNGEAVNNMKFAQYDPVTDTIIRFKNMDAVEIYHIETAKFKHISLTNNSVVLGRDYTAMDLGNRVIYLLGYVKANGVCCEWRFYRYNMDGQYLTDLGPLPSQAARFEESYMLWDSANEVVIWLVDGYEINLPTRMYVYDPNTNAWKQEPINQPDGLTVYGNAAVYDPYQNVIMLMGASGDVPNIHIFLYRYGNGESGGVDTTPPSPPRNLKLKVGEF